mmetsp:Transcript_43417/g.130229  ORF Transcript_43417/g.130229 Transcript_43417/m.130229 type:complete len:218 (-) Transcript_43417:530-1183(-)
MLTRGMALPVCGARPTPARISASGVRRSVAARSTAWGEQKQSNMEKAMWGENFGARDATAGELESNFSEKTIGNWDTLHMIKIPASAAKFVGIGSRAIKPSAELTVLEGKEFDLLKNQVPGWRVVDTPDGLQALRQEWKAKDDASAPEIATRLQSVQVEGSESHTPHAMDVSGSSVTVWLTTPSAGGITENDFIIASRMNDADVKALQAKKKARFWA